MQAIDEIVAADDDDGWAATGRAQQALNRTHDIREGVAAFLDKRAPRWTAT